MDNFKSLTKSEALAEPTESAHSNLLNEAMDFVHKHPVETAVVAAGVALGTVSAVYRVGPALSAVGRKIEGQFSRVADDEANVLLNTHGDLGAYLHPDALRSAGASESHRSLPGIYNHMIGYDSYGNLFGKLSENSLAAGSHLSEEAIDEHIHGLLSTEEGRAALRRMGWLNPLIWENVLIKEARSWKGGAELEGLLPGVSSEKLPENSATAALDKFLRQNELIENIVSLSKSP